MFWNDSFRETEEIGANVRLFASCCLMPVARALKRLYADPLQFPIKQMHRQTDNGEITAIYAIDEH